MCSHLVHPVEELKDADETGSGEQAQGPTWNIGKISSESEPFYQFLRLALPFHISGTLNCYFDSLTDHTDALGEGHGAAKHHLLRVGVVHLDGDLDHRPLEELTALLDRLRFC